MSKNEVTCDCCGRLFTAQKKNYHCSHCNKYFHVCPLCEEKSPKCRFDGVPLKKKRQPVAASPRKTQRASL